MESSPPSAAWVVNRIRANNTYKAQTVTTTPPPHLSLFQLFFPNLLLFHIFQTAMSDPDCTNLILTEIEGDFPCDSYFPEFSHLFSLQRLDLLSTYQLRSKQYYMEALIPNRNADTHHILFNYLRFGCSYEFGLFSDSPKPLLIVCIFDLNPHHEIHCFLVILTNSSPFFLDIRLVCHGAFLSHTSSATRLVKIMRISN